MRPGLTCVMSAMQAFFGGNLSLIFASLSQSEVRRDYSASVSASVSVSTSCVVALERTWSRSLWRLTTSNSFLGHLRPEKTIAA